MRLSRLPVLALLSLLAACAVTPREEAVESPEIVETGSAPGDSAFDTVGEAIDRLYKPQPGEAAPPNVWDRVVGRLELNECPNGSTAQAWARWYAGNPEYMARVFNRATPWLHDIVNEIELRGLPGDLALLPIVESAYDPFAYSHGHAAGSWQFLVGTAREFGLTINDWYDGRRDVYASTRAALDFLEFLRDFFDGEWTLAVAAYNAGPGRVSRAMERNRRHGRPTSWAHLPLPEETRGYVPKLQGLSCLFDDPAAYGFELTHMDDTPRFAVVDLPGPTDIVIAADLAGLEIAELVALNPGLSRHMTPPDGPHYLVVPVENAQALEQAASRMPPAQRNVWQEIRVNRGDTLSGLARRHQTTAAALRQHNGLNGDSLSVGQVLRIPSADGRTQDPAYAAGYRELARLQESLLPEARFHHRVSRGESLSRIAARYNVSVSDLKRWNRLSGNTIHPGQRLVVHGAGTAGADIHYIVQRGDSLWAIARKHRVNISDLRRWNGLSANAVLRPGQRLTIRRGG